MNQAFLILAHTNPEQIACLVQQLSSPKHSIFIHIDRTVDIEPFRKALASQPIQFIQNREAGNWGGLGIVLATIHGIREILQSDHEFSHLHLLSGQDFPLQSNVSIDTFFGAQKDTDFIEFEPFPLTHMPSGGMERIEHHSINAFGRRHTYLPFRYCEGLSMKGYVINSCLYVYQKWKGKRIVPYELVPFYGSQWWSLTKQSLQYIIGFLDDHTDYITYHSASLLPDEMFFQTILLNAKSLPEPLNDNQRYIDWTEQKGSHPKQLDETDIHVLSASTKFFARKFAPRSTLYTLLILD